MRCGFGARRSGGILALVLLAVCFVLVLLRGRGDLRSGGCLVGRFGDFFGSFAGRCRPGFFAALLLLLELRYLLPWVSMRVRVMLCSVGGGGGTRFLAAASFSALTRSSSSAMVGRSSRLWCDRRDERVGGKAEGRRRWNQQHYQASCCARARTSARIAVVPEACITSRDITRPRSRSDDIDAILQSYFSSL